MSFFSNLLGYILNFIYSLVNNYGIAIILFTVFIKVVLLPMSIKQQKTLKKTEKIQEETKKIQEKYGKGNQEKINQEVMALYQRENMNPLGGCFSSIIQIVLILAMFSLIRQPLTHMKKINSQEIEQYEKIVTEQGQKISQTYPEISIIKYVKENNIKESNFYINTEFFGLDLSQVPQENNKDYKVYIIPAMYVISSFISIKITTKKKNEQNENKEKEENQNQMAQVSNSMNWFIPIMAVSISLVAPLGLALYWLVNNILTILERIFIDNFMKEENK